MIMRASRVRVVLEAVQASHRHVGKGACLGNDLLVADLEGDFTFKDVERLFFPAVNVGRRTAARPHDGLNMAYRPSVSSPVARKR